MQEVVKKKLLKVFYFKSLYNQENHSQESEESLQTIYNDENNFDKKKEKYLYFIIKVIFMSSYLNILLFFVPLGILYGYFEWNPTLVFIFNFLAIFPLATILSFLTEELSMKVGQTTGSLLNASLGNVVEMIISIIALNKGQLRIVQTSMLGSILSNDLLVLGICFIAGGLHYQEQQFNMTVAQTMSSLMAVATSSLLIPAAFRLSLPGTDETNKNIIILSRGTSIILLIIYFLYLIFQLKTHTEFYETVIEDTHKELIPPIVSAVFLVLVTLLVSLCAEYLIDSIDLFTASYNVNKTFIGLILIPIVGNAAEHATAVIVSVKNKMDLAVGVALGSSMQIALFVTPFLIIIGWVIGQPLTLYFKTFETVIMFVSVFIINYLIQDGKSNWLEGIMLIAVYCIISIAFFLYPEQKAV
ncbi:calcium/proton exchanger [Pneumocystis murina B123]|uniref:Vacuolar calcium ion transporter n=1 Tax=Pneumocystis murina (strain B123) TaxID=1069680 RepID=M7NMP7_PNEMU|nr:calcium/proton exchanger [Pneumocystis murina B123]EMR09958.1 calcium/proton exchanger [Pneumocystis murina B123]